MRARARLGRLTWGRAPPPTRPTLATTRTWRLAPRARRRLRARALAWRSSSATRAAEHPQGGDGRHGLGFIQIEAQGGLQARQGELVGAQGPGEGVLAQASDHLPGAQGQAGLGAAQELVAGEEHQVGAGLQGFLDGGLPLDAVTAEIDQAAAAQVLHHQKIDSAGPGLPDPARLPRR